MREPFLNFILQVDWYSGNLHREYSTLIDPVYIHEKKTQEEVVKSSVTAPASSVSEQNNNTPTTKDTEDTIDETQLDKEKLSVSEQTDKPFLQYGPTNKNDTLWAIAAKLRPSKSYSIEQVVMSLLSENPKAFLKGNINFLRPKQTLLITEESKLLEMDKEEAKKHFRQQMKDWKAYIAAKKQTTVHDTRIPMENSTPIADETLAADAKVEEMVEKAALATDEAMNVEPDKTVAIKDVTENIEDDAEKSTEEEVEVEVEEDNTTVATTAEIDDVNTMMPTTEGNVVQESGTSEKALTPEQESDVNSQALATDEAMNVEPDKTVAIKDVTENIKDDVEKNTEEEEEVEEDNTTVATTAEIDDVNSQALTTDETVNVEPIATNNIKEDAVTVSDNEAVKNPAPSWIEDNTQLLVIASILGGIILIVLIVIRVIIVKRDKDGDDFSTALLAKKNATELHNSTLPDTEINYSGETEKGSIDTKANSASSFVDDDRQTSFLSSFTGDSNGTALAQGENTNIDPMSEIDLLILYGQFGKVENILHDVLKEDADNPEYYVKLLEVYERQKKVAEFRETAEKFREILSEDPVNNYKYIQQAKSFADSICPDEHLFDADALVMKSTAKKGKETVQNLSAPTDMPDLLTEQNELEKVDLFASVREEENGDGLGALLDEENSATDSIDDSTLELDVDAELLDALDSKISELEDGGEGDDSTTLNSSNADMEAHEEFTSSLTDIELDIDLGEIGDEGTEKEPDDNDTLMTTSLDFDIGLTEEEQKVNTDLGDLSVENKEESDTLEMNTLATDVDTENDEISTKIDLAKAYIEMGDKVSAQEIINEINAKDNPKYAAEIQSLLTSLSKDEMDIGLDLDIDLDSNTNTSDNNNDLSENLQESLNELNELVSEIDNNSDISELDDFDIADQDVDDLAADTIGTKIDLATAYFEMGDEESAKKILQEVLAEGNEKQKAQAGKIAETLKISL